MALQRVKSRPGKTPAVTGHRANINIGGASSLFGGGQPGANPDYVSPSGNAGDVNPSYAGDPSDYLKSNENVPFTRPGFFSRMTNPQGAALAAQGNQQVILNRIAGQQNIQDTAAIAANQDKIARDRFVFENAERLKNVAKEQAAKLGLTEDDPRFSEYLSNLADSEYDKNIAANEASRTGSEATTEHNITAGNIERETRTPKQETALNQALTSAGVSRGDLRNVPLQVAANTSNLLSDPVKNALTIRHLQFGQPMQPGTSTPYFNLNNPETSLLEPPDQRAKEMALLQNKPAPRVGVEPLNISGNKTITIDGRQLTIPSAGNTGDNNTLSRIISGQYEGEQNNMPQAPPNFSPPATQGMGDLRAAEQNIPAPAESNANQPLTSPWGSLYDPLLNLINRIPSFIRRTGPGPANTGY